MEGVGSQKNRKKNQDTPIEEFSPTGPVIWLLVVKHGRSQRPTKEN